MALAVEQIILVGGGAGHVTLGRGTGFINLFAGKKGAICIWRWVGAGPPNKIIAGGAGAPPPFRRLSMDVVLYIGQHYPRK